MSDSKAIEFFAELDIKWHHLQELNDDQRSALAIVCFAVSEINALSRIYLFAQQELTGKSAIDFAIMTQTHSILRSWSAKLFEISEFLTFRDKDNRTSDERLVGLGNLAISDFEKLRNLDGYRAARALRHETTNHYLLKPVKKNLRYVSDNAACTFYLHRQNGNSIYPLGDEVVFAARLNREGSIFETSEEKLKVYQNWFDWNLEATTWIHRVHLIFYKEFVAPIARANSIKLRQQSYWIDPAYVSSSDKPKIPVVFRRDE